MSLFKINEGPSERLDQQHLTEGYAWFTPDTGDFYIDANQKQFKHQSSSSKFQLSPVASIEFTNKIDNYYSINTSSKNAYELFFSYLTLSEEEYNTLMQRKTIFIDYSRLNNSAQPAEEPIFSINGTTYSKNRTEFAMRMQPGYYKSPKYSKEPLYRWKDLLKYEFVGYAFNAGSHYYQITTYSTNTLEGKNFIPKYDTLKSSYPFQIIDLDTSTGEERPLSDGTRVKLTSSESIFFQCVSELETLQRLPLTSDRSYQIIPKGSKRTNIKNYNYEDLKQLDQQVFNKLPFQITQLKEDLNSNVSALNDLQQELLTSMDQKLNNVVKDNQPTNFSSTVNFQNQITCQGIEIQGTATVNDISPDTNGFTVVNKNYVDNKVTQAMNGITTVFVGASNQSAAANASKALLWIQTNGVLKYRTSISSNTWQIVPVAWS